MEPCPWTSQVYTPNHCTVLSPFSTLKREGQGSGRTVLPSSVAQGWRRRLPLPSVGGSDLGFSLFPCVPVPVRARAGACTVGPPTKGQERGSRGWLHVPDLHPAAFIPPLKHRFHVFELKILAFSSGDLGLFTQSGHHVLLCAAGIIITPGLLSR